MDIPYSPCPFCGVEERAPTDDGPLMAARSDITRKWSIDCLACGAEGPKANSLHEAAIKWNSRK